VASLGLPPCLGHDLFEGIVTYDMMLVKQYFVRLNWFTYDELNHRIQAWPYDGTDKLDAPAPVLGSSDKLRGNAVQNWVFSSPDHRSGFVRRPSSSVVLVRRP